MNCPCILSCSSSQRGARRERPVNYRDCVNWISLRVYCPPVNAVLGVNALSNIVIESTVPVYCHVRQVNAVSGVNARSTISIESTVPVYFKVRLFNALLGVFAQSTFVIEAIVPVYCQVCQVNLV
jgi:hypothetical protein